MRKIYKYLIVVGVCVTFLLCSVISVGAESITQTFISSASDVVSISFTGDENEFYVGKIVATGRSPDNTLAFNIQAQTTAENADFFWYCKVVNLTIKPVEGFLENFSFYEDLNLTFRCGQRPAFSNEFSSLLAVEIILTDLSKTTSVSKISYSPSVDSNDMQFTSITFSNDDLQSLSEVSSISIRYFYRDYFSFTDYMAGIVMKPYATVTYSGLNDEYITEGWTPNPEKPAGSDSVGDLGSIEEELQQGAQEGINAGMDMITGLGDSLTGFQKGFAFFMSFSDELLGKVTWMSSVLTIGLALGIVAFLLNIVGSVASKVSRDERRAEADKRRAERDAQREKQNKR